MTAGAKRWKVWGIKSGVGGVEMVVSLLGGGERESAEGFVRRDGTRRWGREGRLERVESGSVCRGEGRLYSSFARSGRALLIALGCRRGGQLGQPIRRFNWHAQSCDRIEMSIVRPSSELRTNRDEWWCKNRENRIG